MTPDAEQKESPFSEMAARMTARGELEAKIQRLRNEANYLEALLKALPPELPRDADHALWALVIGVR